MARTFYDSISLNSDILLDLPFREGTGAITHDVAKPHHPVTLVSTPTWASLASNLGVLELDGATEYLQALNADTADLDFMAGDYSLSIWFKWTDTGSSEILMGRYEVDVSGWETYLYTGGGSTHYLQLRHHHAGGATTRTGAYSSGWTPGTWYLFGLSRSGGDAVMYRNGAAVETSVSVGGLIDPETCAQDLVIGTRYTKNADWYDGQLWRPRIWDRALTSAEWKVIYELEKRWFP